MKITQIDSGFSIEFPFELKDNFKVAFPSAKWNANQKRWEVGPRSGERLKQWAAAASGAATALEERDQVELKDDELATLTAQLADIEAGIRGTLNEHAKAEQNTAALAELAQRIEAASGQLAEAKAALVDAQAAEQAEKQRIDALLGNVVDLAEIHRQADVMARNMVPADRAKKGRFEEARQFIKSQRDALREAGWQCEAINLLASANVNRKDRDHPNLIKQADWYAIKEYSDDE